MDYKIQRPPDKKFLSTHSKGILSTSSGAYFLGIDASGNVVTYHVITEFILEQPAIDKNLGWDTNA